MKLSRLQNSIFSRYVLFWNKYPALSIGIFLYLITFVAFGYLYVLLLFILFLFPICICNFRFAFWILFISCSTFFFLKHKNHFPENDQLITGHIRIESIQEKGAPFGKKGWEYRGLLKSFSCLDGKTTPTSIPFVMFILKNEIPILAGMDYEIIATAILQKNKKIRLKLKQEEISPINKSRSLTKWRYETKKNVKQCIEHSVSDPTTASFLSALAIGELNDSVLRKEFEQCGLVHLMAISGFHFSLLALFFDLFLRNFLGPKKGSIILLVLLSLYLVFIGKSPSIERSYIMISCFLISALVKRRYLAINALGCALAISTLRDPFSIFELGFQFSYLATAGILFLYRPIEIGLETLIPRRSFLEILVFPKIQQHILLVVMLFRKSLAFMMAVNFATLPLSFFYFNQVTLMGWIANLFFPLLISITLFLLFAAFTFPIASQYIFHLNEIYTRHLLRFTEFPPSLLCKSFWVKSFPLPLVIAYLTLLFLLTIFIHERSPQNRSNNFFESKTPRILL